MKRKLTLIVSLVFIQLAQAQSIRDTVFNDVMLVKQENVTVKGDNFLLNIRVRASPKTIIVYNTDWRIPNSFFFSRKTFLYLQNELILVTRDWDYYRAIQKSEIHVTPVRQSKFYHINRISGQTDSLTIREDDPERLVKFNFAKPGLPAPAISLAGKWREKQYPGFTATIDTGKRIAHGEVIYFKNNNEVYDSLGNAGTYQLQGDSLYIALGKAVYYFRLFPGDSNKQKMVFVPVTDTYQYSCDAGCAILYEQPDTSRQMIKGVVLDEQDKGIANAQVMLKGMKTGVMTDAGGRFQLLAREDDILEISHCCNGYIGQQVLVTTKSDYTIKLLQQSRPKPTGRYKRYIKRELRKHGYYKYPD